jgi:hypothetical protein
MRALICSSLLLWTVACRTPPVTVLPPDDGKDGGTQPDAGPVDAGPPQLNLITPYLPPGVAGQVYAPLTLDVVGGVPPYTFMLTGSAPGLTFDQGGFAGTVSESGYYDLDVEVADSETPPQKDARRYQLLITDAPSGTAEISTPKHLPAGVVGESYNLPIELRGINNLAPIDRVGIRFYVEGSSMPAGMDLNTIAGLITGEPTDPGDHLIHVHTVYADGTTLGDKDLVLTVRPTRQTFTASGLDRLTTRHASVSGPSLPTYVRGHTADVLSDGRVIVTGGGWISTPYGATRILEPSGGFSPGPRMIVARTQHTSTQLTTGKLLLVGGVPTTVTPIAELFDPVTGDSQPVSGAWTARYNHAAALLPGDRVLVCGGSEGNVNPFGVATNPALATAAVYDPKAQTFTATGTLATAREYAQATPLPDGRVVITGGAAPANPTGYVEIYDPQTGHFDDGGQLQVPRMFHSATLLPNGLILLAGGMADSMGTRTDSAELYDPKAKTSRLLKPLFRPRALHAAVWMPEAKKVLLFGSAIDNPLNQVPPAYEGAELFDPADESFTPVHTVFQRFGPTVTLLHNGTVAIIGGMTNPEGGDDWRMLISEYFHP